MLSFSGRTEEGNIQDPQIASLKFATPSPCHLIRTNPLVIPSSFVFIKVSNKHLIATPLALVTSPGALASRTFCNSGTLNGWDYVRKEHKGTVDQVTNVVYKGSSAPKMTQTYGSNYHNRYHSEFIANRPGAGWGGDDYVPSTMVWMQGNQLLSRIVTGNYRQPNSVVIMQVKWASDGSGFFKIWLDENKVVERYNTATAIDDDSVFQFRFRQIWYDEIAMGTEFKDVDPDQQ
ncbi:glucuronan lyase A [Metarhizium acridum CQMa 102]|uniref:Glucuronan lyase A n=1 Tax=Metarhizium acridum (strain CQMa 102) TaxID=655827 RepID=E9DUN6_METAQ|nr:glucuronan lyase A [Metarhizium acridum CQMa 102]EFY92698.1 glucuronan lyase A [Metarhizium acridum CQMa 102]